MLCNLLHPDSSISITCLWVFSQCAIKARKAALEDLNVPSQVLQRSCSTPMCTTPDLPQASTNKHFPTLAYAQQLTSSSKLVCTPNWALLAANWSQWPPFLDWEVRVKSSSAVPSSSGTQGTSSLLTSLHHCTTSSSGNSLFNSVQSFEWLVPSQQALSIAQKLSDWKMLSGYAHLTLHKRGVNRRTWRRCPNFENNLLLPSRNCMQCWEALNFGCATHWTIELCPRLSADIILTVLSDYDNCLSAGLILTLVCWL